MPASLRDILDDFQGVLYEHGRKQINYAIHDNVLQEMEIIIRYIVHHAAAAPAGH